MEISPAVTVWAVRIELISNPETSDVELIPAVTSDPPTCRAAEATWVTAKEKFPTVPPGAELAVHVLVELAGAAKRCWKFSSEKPVWTELWKSVSKLLISLSAELRVELAVFSAAMTLFGVLLTAMSWSTSDFQSSPEANPDS
jgi:hypothetical protein